MAEKIPMIRTGKLKKYSNTSFGILFRCFAVWSITLFIASSVAFSEKKVPPKSAGQSDIHLAALKKNATYYRVIAGEWILATTSDTEKQLEAGQEEVNGRTIQGIFDVMNRLLVDTIPTLDENGKAQISPSFWGSLSEEEKSFGFALLRYITCVKKLPIVYKSTLERYSGSADCDARVLLALAHALEGNYDKSHSILDEISCTAESRYLHASEFINDKCVKYFSDYDALKLQSEEHMSEKVKFTITVYTIVAGTYRNVIVGFVGNYPNRDYMDHSSIHPWEWGTKNKYQEAYLAEGTEWIVARIPKNLNEVLVKKRIGRGDVIVIKGRSLGLTEGIRGGNIPLVEAGEITCEQ